MEYADAVRLGLNSIRPDVIAVELPMSLQPHCLRAVRRLPLVSVILYESQKNIPVYWVIAPMDPVVEGVRWGLEHDVPVTTGSIDAPTMHWHDSLPDAYASFRIGPEAYYRQVMQGGAVEEAQRQTCHKMN